MDEQSQQTDDIIRNFRAASIDSICEDIDKKFEDKIKKLISEVESAFVIDESDLSGEITKTIYKIHTLLTKFSEEKILLNKIERRKDDVHGEIYGNLKKGGQMRFDSKQEIEEWINRNPKWLKIVAYYDNQKLVCDLYERLLKSMDQKQWALRTKTDLKKVELGV